MFGKIALKKKYSIWIFIVWVAAQAIFLVARGINDGGETYTYINLAEKIYAAKSLSVLPVNYYLYIGQVMILLCLKILGLPYICMYLVNVTAGTIGLLCYIKLLSEFQLTQLSIFLSALLFCICPFFHEWACFLYTDYIFVNLLLIAIYLLVSYSKKKKPLFPFFVVAIILSFYRPLGFLVFPIAIVLWLTNRQKGTIKNVMISGVSFLLILYFIWYCLNHADGYFYPNHNTEANIICGYPSDLTKYIQHPYDEHKTMAYFFLSNPSMTWRLFLHRAFKGFWMTRPYFSTIHNTLLSLVLLTYYGLVGIGIVAIIKRKLLKSNLYIFSGLAVFTIPIVIFCADWANRFILPALVFVFIIMGFGIDFLLEIARKKNNNKKEVAL